MEEYAYSCFENAQGCNGHYSQCWFTFFLDIASASFNDVVTEILKDKSNNFECKKPYICFMDGVIMVFGIGLCGNGRYTLITETTVLAIPENGIGLFSDVSFAYIAAKKQGARAIEAYLGLDGNRIVTPTDAPHYVLSGNRLKEHLVAITLSEDPDQDIRELCERYNNNPVSELRLRLLLPRIISTFGNNKSIKEVPKEREDHQLSSDTLVEDIMRSSLRHLIHPSIIPIVSVTRICFRSTKTYSFGQPTFRSFADEFVRGNVLPNDVALIFMECPKALNATNRAMHITFQSFLDEWETDPRVKCVVVASIAFRVFSVGLDIMGESDNIQLERQLIVLKNILPVYARGPNMKMKERVKYVIEESGASAFLNNMQANGILELNDLLDCRDEIRLHFGVRAHEYLDEPFTKEHYIEYLYGDVQLLSRMWLMAAEFGMNEMKY